MAAPSQSWHCKANKCLPHWMCHPLLLLLIFIFCKLGKYLRFWIKFLCDLRGHSWLTLNNQSHYQRCGFLVFASLLFSFFWTSTIYSSMSNLENLLRTLLIAFFSPSLGLYTPSQNSRYQWQYIRQPGFPHQNFWVSRSSEHLKEVRTYKWSTSLSVLPLAT